MICFYYPDKGIGGVQLIIINITEQLSKLGHCIKVICYDDSVIIRELKNRKVSFSFVNLHLFNQSSSHQYIDKEDIVVFFDPYKDWSLFSKVNPKIFLWIVFPKTFDHLNMISRFQIPFVTKRLIHVLIKKNCMAFMDRAGVDEIKNSFGIIIKGPKFLPVPVKDIEKNIYLNKQRSILKNEFQVTYIGRGVDWKYYPCLRIIQDLSAIQINNIRIKLHVLTDDIEFYKSRILKDVQETSGLEIMFHQDINGPELDEFLIQNTDLNISMGTSCLEGSKFGIPSLLIDASYEKISNVYKYRWIFETIDYCLGYILDKDREDYKQGGSLDGIIHDLILNEDFRSQISRQCFQYTKGNHSLYSVTDRFIRIIGCTEARVLNVSKYSIRRSKFFLFLKNLWKVARK